MSKQAEIFFKVCHLERWHREHKTWAGFIAAPHSVQLVATRRGTRDRQKTIEKLYLPGQHLRPCELDIEPFRAVDLGKVLPSDAVATRTAAYLGGNAFILAREWIGCGKRFRDRSHSPSNENADLWFKPCPRPTDDT